MEENKKSNPWKTATIILGIIFLAVLIYSVIQERKNNNNIIFSTDKLCSLYTHLISQNMTNASFRLCNNPDEKICNIKFRFIDDPCEKDK